MSIEVQVRRGRGTQQEFWLRPFAKKVLSACTNLWTSSGRDSWNAVTNRGLPSSLGSSLVKGRGLERNRRIVRRSSGRSRVAGKLVRSDLARPFSWGRRRRPRHPAKPTGQGAYLLLSTHVAVLYISVPFRVVLDCSYVKGPSNRSGVLAFPFPTAVRHECRHGPCGAPEVQTRRAFFIYNTRLSLLTSIWSYHLFKKLN
jgi:hypothetical protein